MSIGNDFEGRSIALLLLFELLITVEDNIVVFYTVFGDEGNGSCIIRVASVGITLRLREALIIVIIPMASHISPRLLARLLCANRRSGRGRPVFVHSSNSEASATEQAEHIFFGEVSIVDEVRVNGILKVSPLYPN